jgi:hypothetical protein
VSVADWDLAAIVFAREGRVALAEQAAERVPAPSMRMLYALADMARRARAMLSDALDAFIRGDGALGRAVGKADDDVDVRVGLEGLRHATAPERPQTCHQHPSPTLGGQARETDSGRGGCSELGGGVGRLVEVLRDQAATGWVLERWDVAHPNHTDWRLRNMS